MIDDYKIPSGAALLLHPQLPKPLHGVAPRVIMGKEWWDLEREEAYYRSNYCCQACGVGTNKSVFQKRWLEAHEWYLYDCKRFRLYYVGAVALCYYCHNFIHAGRMEMLCQTNKMSRTRQQEVRDHGMDLLKRAGLVSTWWSMQNAVIGSEDDWKHWRLVFNDKQYGPSTQSRKEWEQGLWRDWTPEEDRRKSMSELQDNDPMPFGKYQGTAMVAVPASYMLWLYSASNDRGTPVSLYISNNKEAIEARYARELGDTPIHFGKYKGTPLRDVPASYLVWVSEQDWFGEKPGALYDYISNNIDDIARQAETETPDNSVKEVKW